MTRLKDKRMERGLSQSQLARISGISVRVIQAYEQGERKLEGAAVVTVIKLADALGCDVREIINTD